MLAPASLFQSLDLGIWLWYKFLMSSNNNTKMPKAKTLSRKSFIVTTILLSIALALLTAVFLLFFCYAIVMTVATLSAMIFLILFGLSLHFLALAMLCFFGISTVRTKHGLAPLLSKEKRQIKNKGTLLDSSKKNPAPHTVFQVVGLAIFALGVISVVISAGLGAISKDGWTRELSYYRQSRGYHATTKRLVLNFVENPNLKIELTSKNAVVIFDDDITKTRLEFYDEFEKQVNITQSENTMILTESKAPQLNRTLDKMLFFIFEPSKNVQQIKIYIPASLKDTISIEGDYILALD